MRLAGAFCEHAAALVRKAQTVPAGSAWEVLLGRPVGKQVGGWALPAMHVAGSGPEPRPA